MPNLNYDVPQDVPQGDHQGDHQIDEVLSIKNMISANGNITVNEMADKLGVSPETVRRRIKKDSRIKYVGSGYSGHWEIEE